MPKYNDDHKYDNEFRIDSDGSEKCNYRIVFTGFCHGEQVDDHDDVGEKSVAGHVQGGTDVVSFNGVPKGIEASPDLSSVTMSLNGRQVEGFHLNMRTLVIMTDADKAPYEVSVSGKIIGTAQTNANDVPFDGNRATGVVRGGYDTYYYSGCLTGIDSNQDLAVEIDGEPRTVAGNPPHGVL